MFFLNISSFECHILDHKTVNKTTKHCQAGDTRIPRPRKKTWFFMAKTVGIFSQNRDFLWFLSWTQKPWKTCEFHKTYDLQWPKSQKLPNNQYNERAVVRIVIENGAEISDYSALAWHCVTGTFLDGCFKLFKLTRLSLWTMFSTWNMYFFLNMLY